MICVQREESWVTSPTPIEYGNMLRDAWFANKTPVEVALFFADLYEQFNPKATTEEQKLKVDMFLNSAKLMLATGFEMMFSDYTYPSMYENYDKSSNRQVLKVAKQFNKDLAIMPIVDVCEKYQPIYSKMVDKIVKNAIKTTQMQDYLPEVYNASSKNEDDLKLP